MSPITRPTLAPTLHEIQANVHSGLAEDNGKMSYTKSPQCTPLLPLDSCMYLGCRPTNWPCQALNNGQDSGHTHVHVLDQARPQMYLTRYTVHSSLRLASFNSW